MFRVLLQFFKRRGYYTLENNKLKIFIIFFILFWYSSSGYLFFELQKKPDLNWLDAVWWTLVTMTTVGYGDYFPVSTGGRYLIGVPTMLFGIGFLGLIISEVAANFIESRSKRVKGMLYVNSKNHILIINFTSIEKIIKIIDELRADPITKDRDICLIDEYIDEIPAELYNQNILFVKGNPTNVRTLEQANLKDASHVIILSRDPGNPHSDDQNLATTLVIEDMNPGVFSITEVVDPNKTKQIEIAGCDSTICASELSANLIIKEIQDPGVKNILFELTSNKYGQQIYFVSIKKMINWTYRELSLWCLDNNYTPLGILRNNNYILNCASDSKIEPEDKVIIISDKRIHYIEIS